MSPERSPQKSMAARGARGIVYDPNDPSPYLTLTELENYHAGSTIAAYDRAHLFLTGEISVPPVDAYTRRSETFVALRLTPGTTFLKAIYDKFSYLLDKKLNSIYNDCNDLCTYRWTSFARGFTGTMSLTSINPASY